mgnify:CR=1 FL=1
MQSEILICFGKTIRQLRLERSISQESFADMCGLHRTYISDIELGKRNVSLENIDKMSHALNITLPDLFERVTKNACIH